VAQQANEVHQREIQLLLKETNAADLLVLIRIEPPSVIIETTLEMENRSNAHDE